MVFFLAPPVNAFISGGNKFNQDVIKVFASQNINFRSISIVEINQPNFIHSDLLIVDAIYLNALDSEFLESLPCKKILFVHLLPSMLFPSELKNEKGKILYFDIVVVNSEFSALYLTTHFSSSEVKVVCPFISDHQDKTNNFCKGKFIVVANWLPHKQQFQLLEELDPNIWPENSKLHFYGDISIDSYYFESCKELIGNKKLQPYIQIHGGVSSDELIKVYQSAELFIDVSLFETYGMAVAEALNHKINILTLGNGNIKNLVNLKSICIDVAHLLGRIHKQDFKSNFPPDLLAYQLDRSLFAEKVLTTFVV